MPTPTMTKWEEFKELWEQHMQLVRMRSKSKDLYLEVVDMVDRYIAPTTLHDVGPSALADMAETMLQRYHPNTVFNTFCKIRYMLRIAFENGLIPHIPRLPKIKPDRSVTGRALTDAEFARLLACSHNDAWRRVWKAACYAGLRCSEITMLAWDNPELPHICEKQGVRCIVWPRVTQKSGVEDVIPCTPQMNKLIDNEFTQSERWGYVLTKHMPGCKHRAASTRSIRRNMQQCATAADVWVTPTRTATVHDLRRTFATYWAQRLQAGELRVLMRHASINTTMKCYVHLDPVTLSKTLGVYDVTEPRRSP